MQRCLPASVAGPLAHGELVPSFNILEHVRRSNRGTMRNLSDYITDHQTQRVHKEFFAPNLRLVRLVRCSSQSSFVLVLCQVPSSPHPIIRTSLPPHPDLPQILEPLARAATEAPAPDRSFEKGRGHMGPPVFCFLSVSHELTDPKPQGACETR